MSRLTRNYLLKGRTRREPEVIGPTQPEYRGVESVSRVTSVVAPPVRLLGMRWVPERDV